MASDRQKLWNIYRAARAAQKDGVGFKQISDMVRTLGQRAGVEVDGITDLQQKLGIEGDFGDVETDQLVQGGAQMVGQGATLGLSDEVAGLARGAMAMVPGGMSPVEAYVQGRDRVRNQTDLMRAEKPKTAMGLEMAGGILPAMATGGLGGARATGSLIARMAKTGGKMGALGALEGGVYGANAAEGGIGERAVGALGGAAMGGAAGGLLGFAGPAVGQLGRKAMTNIRPVREAGVNAAARRTMGGILDEAGRTPQEAADALRGMRTGSVLADTDPMLADYAKAAKSGASALRREGGPVENIITRNSLKGERIVRDTRNLTGLRNSIDPDEALDVAVKSWRRKFLQPLQEAGDEYGSARIRRVLKAYPEISEFLPNAEKVRQTQKMSLADGWDALQVMKHKIGGNIPSNQKERLIKASRALQDTMEKDRPEFAELTSRYAKIMERFDAYKMGEKLAWKPRREIQKAWRALGDSERQSFRQGMMDAFETGIEVAEGEGAKVTRLTSKGEQAHARARLRALFDTDEAFKRWTNALDTEGRWARTANALQGNSSTTQQLADLQNLGAVVTRAPSLLNELLSVIIEDENMQREVAERVGRILMEMGPEEAAAEMMKLVDPGLLAKIGQGITGRGLNSYVSQQAGRTGGLLATGREPGGLLE